MTKTKLLTILAVMVLVTITIPPISAHHSVELQDVIDDISELFQITSDLQAQTDQNTSDVSDIKLGVSNSTALLDMIEDLETVQLSEQAEQDQMQLDIATLQGQVSILSAGGGAETNTNLELAAQASSSGAINPQIKEFVFYGDILCEIEASGFVVIEFGGNTTVQHNTNCSALNGDLIILDTVIDELFQIGDILVLDRVATTWNEVYRSQTP